MDFKTFLVKRKIRQIDIAKELNVSAPLVSDWVRKVRAVPPQYRRPLAKFLKTTAAIVTRMTK